MSYQVMNDVMTSDAPDALLHRLHAAVAGEVRAGHDLTLRQLAVVLTLHLSDDPQTVRGLARHLRVSKPVVTRAFDRLSEVGLMRRKVAPLDRRSVVAVRTEAGQAMVARLKASLAAEADGAR
jgi:DNA-binding MarR family transcriptional regulator